MSAFDERRRQDVQKLHQLAEQSGARMKVGRVSGNPPREIDVELHLKTAPSRQYPNVKQDVTRFTISLPARYPLAEPSVTIRTPILHPNVYASGQICLGMKWLPASGLDLLVRRIAQIIAFDPAVLNERSPANRDALEWYRDARHRHAGAFPTDTWTLAVAEQRKKMNWSDVSSAQAKTVIACPSCRKRLSLLSGRSGTVKCPHCGNSFKATT
jgi:ubiquitin-protein ligase